MVAILQVDIAGTPQNWLNPQEVASLFCAGDIAWSLDPIVATLHGGRSKHGIQTVVEIPSIVATKGTADINLLNVEPNLTRHNDKLFTRDRHLCAYCGHVFHRDELTREHVMPVSRGGADHWMNVVTACKSCNSYKANKTPEEAKMELLYLPYIPNRFEDFLLQRGGKTILADQMEFLLEKVPHHSRIRLS